MLNKGIADHYMSLSFRGMKEARNVLGEPWIQKVCSGFSHRVDGVLIG